MQKLQSKLLVANRGEIACRIMKTAHRLKIPTVGIYSDIDRLSRHSQMAMESFRVGENPSARSYLNMERIIEVALQTHSKYIHPGFGFLSENEAFCRLCRENEIKFVGPPVEAIELMGSKQASKITMEKAGVPVVPGYHGDNQLASHLHQEADRIGYPVLIKATMGGGGKGMRIVDKQEDFLEALEAAQRESRKHFNDDRVILERFIKRSRHVEVQVFGDSQGNYVYLFERDCSIQRRHQKVVEEAPSAIPEALRTQIGESAVAAARAVKYENAGTVEFIFDVETQEYFFMEMNTRLQVEHPITEMITRQDLVEWQLRVAQGQPLPLRQEQLTRQGHSFEARIYSEDPFNAFLPANGRLAYLREPQEIPDYLRVESGVRQGDSISTFYDPMIAKLVVWDQDRDKALQRLRQGLEDYRVVGLPTNIEFLQRVCNNTEFQQGDYDTNFIEENTQQLLARSSTVDDHDVISVAVAHAGPALMQGELCSLRVNRRKTSQSEYLVSSGSLAEEVSVEVKVEFRGGKNLKVEVAGRAYEVEVQKVEADQLQFSTQEGLFQKQFFQENEKTFVFGNNGCSLQFQRKEEVMEREEGEMESSKATYSPMPGTVSKVSVEVGEQVSKGQTLVVVEAMKMEHNVKATQEGKVKSISTSQGAFVEQGMLLVELE